jgi:HSP20 family molecular chaperone IbpA
MSQDIQTTRGGATPATTTPETPAAPVQTVVPPVDVFEDEAGITVLADLPGVGRDTLGVRIDGDSLVIEGTAQVPGPPDLQLVHAEAQVPAYRREFTLSRELDASRIEAQLKDGVLRVTIPKAEEAKPRRIQVQVG